MGKLSERMSHFWTVWFLETEAEPNFGFPHIGSLLPRNFPAGWHCTQLQLFNTAAVQLMQIPTNFTSTNPTTPLMPAKQLKIIIQTSYARHRKHCAR